MRGLGWGSIVLGGLILFCPEASSAAAPPPVFFRELMWAGTDRSTADEWFVLSNSTADQINLDGWRITVINSTVEKLLTNLDGQIIAAHGSLLIASHDQHHQFSAGESVLGIDPDLIVSSLSLSNTTLQLKLYDPINPSPVDIAGNGKAPLKGSVGSATKVPSVPWTAMERINPSSDGTLAASWLSATAAIVHHLDQATDPTRLTYAAPDHAGRPDVTTSTLSPIPTGTLATVSVTVKDPDGEDDIESVWLNCQDESVNLVDMGLAGDPIAGDRSYSGRMVAKTTGSVNCEASVTDRSGLNRTKVVNRKSYVRTANVVINEISPSPIEGVEFIELHNLDQFEIDLTGWQLDDRQSGGSQPFVIPDTIPAGGFLVIGASRSKLALNNDGDDVNLINPEGTVIDSTHYGSAQPGRSWARFRSAWQWVSLPTPNLVNQIDLSEQPTTSSTVLTPSVADFANLSSQTVVQLTGQVVATPGTFSAHSWLLADGTGVAEIYLDHGSFAPLSIGTWVSVTGRRSAISRPRLLIDRGETDPPDRPTKKIDARPLAGVLSASVSMTEYVHGDVLISRANNRSLVGTVNGRSITIVWSELYPNQVFDSSLAAGQTVTVTAILTYDSANRPTLTLRSGGDLVAGPLPNIVPVSSVAVGSVAESHETSVADPVILQLIQKIDRSVKSSVLETVVHVQRAQQFAALATAARWLDISIQATAINGQLAILVHRRSFERIDQWRQFDRSAMVGLLLVLGSLQLAISWRRLTLIPDSPLPWLGG